MEMEKVKSAVDMGAEAINITDKRQPIVDKYLLSLKSRFNAPITNMQIIRNAKKNKINCAVIILTPFPPAIL